MVLLVRLYSELRSGLTSDRLQLTSSCTTHQSDSQPMTMRHPASLLHRGHIPAFKYSKFQPILSHPPYSQTIDYWLSVKSADLMPTRIILIQSFRSLHLLAIGFSLCSRHNDLFISGALFGPLTPIGVFIPNMWHTRSLPRYRMRTPGVWAASALVCQFAWNFQVITYLT